MKFKKLKYVILNVEYTSLSKLDDTDDFIWRKYYYKSYMDLDVPIISVFNPELYFLSATRSFSTNFKLLKRYFDEGTILDCDDNGFGINYTKEKRKLNFDVITPVRVNGHEDNLFDFTQNTKRIQLIINQCKNKGVRVILATMPVAKGYANGVNQGKLHKIFKTCLSLEKKNTNVHYLNLFKDSRFTDDDFFDPDHLHTEGAKKCSVVLNRFVMRF